jgi:serine protease AprX
VIIIILGLVGTLYFWCSYPKKDIMIRLDERFWLLLGGLFLLPIFLFAQSEKVEDALWADVENGGKFECLIVLQEQVNLSLPAARMTKEDRAQFVFSQLRQQAERSQKKVRQLLTDRGDFFQAFYVVNAVHAVTDREGIELLAALPEVARIQSEPLLVMEEPLEMPGGELVQRDPTPEWGIQMIRADKVWDLGFTGQGVVVGGQDTGYEWDHPALKNTYRGWNGVSAEHNYNWYDAIDELSPLHNYPSNDPSNNPCGLDLDTPCDDHNHGTHTMGTMVGLDGDNLIGVAPGAEWIGCRNMEWGYGSPSTYLECFEFFLAPTDVNGNNPDPSKAPHVINNSWSCPELEGCNPDNFSILETAVNNLKASGVVVVVSAGNSGSQGCGSVSTPSAIFENSFSIGATGEDDAIAGFSSRGPVLVDGSNRMKPNVSAPGVNVRSCIRNGEYASYQGTSMAGPHVAGAVALIISANPELAGQVEAIETILEETAVPKFDPQECGGTPGSAHPNNTYGYGRIDVFAAVNSALELLGQDTQTVSSVLGVEVLPNPFAQELVVTLTGLRGTTTFELFDVSGRLVYQKEWNLPGRIKEVLTLPELSSGTYFFLVSNGDETKRGKLVK